MTKPWWTLLFAFKYNCLHSFYNTSREAYASHCHSQGMRTNAFSKYTNAKNRFFSLARYLPCSCLTMKMASVVPLPVAKPNWNSAMSTISHIILSSTQLPSRSVLSSSDSCTVVVSIYGITLAFVQIDNETDVPVCWDMALSNEGHLRAWLP